MRVAKVVWVLGLCGALWGCRAAAPVAEPAAATGPSVGEASGEAVQGGGSGSAVGAEPRTSAPGEAGLERVPAPGTLVAIGDIHGDVTALRRVLQTSEVMDESGRWIGGDLGVVLLGDLTDRGSDEPEVLALVQSLQQQAPADGGWLRVVLGNHETMNVAGDLRYVATDAWDGWGEAPNDPRLAQVPEMARARVAAFSPGGVVARWLATLPVFLVVGDTLFVHGGVLPPHVDAGLGRINTEVAAWISGDVPGPPAWITGEDSPLWTRVWSMPGAEPDCALLGETLQRAGVARLVVGHTVQPTGISSACDGLVWRVDTGLSAHYGGPTESLRIRGAVVDVMR